MRGILSFLYAFAAITAILFFYSYYSSLRSGASETDRNILLLEDRNMRELELKRAVTDTIRHSALEAIAANPSANADDIRDYIGEELAKLKQLSDYRYYDVRTLETRFWCGSPSIEDIVNSVRTTQWYGSSFTCSGCHPIDEFHTIVDPSDNQVKLKRTCSLYLTVNMVDHSVSISYPDVRASPLLSFTNVPQFGIMIYDSSINISSVVLLPHSTTVRWLE